MLYVTGNGQYAVLYTSSAALHSSLRVVNLETGEIRETPEGMYIVLCPSDSGFIP